MIILTPKADYKFLARDGREDPSDWSDLDYKVIRETWVENVYQIHADQFYDTGVFVDVGANIGAVSLYVDDFNKLRADDESKPTIKTYAIEPQPNNLEFLEKNIADNPASDNITVVKNAIWFENANVEISNRGGNSSLYQHEKALSYDSVEAFTIERFFDVYKIKEADVMKMDIEGAEYPVLINTPLEVLRRIKYLALEFDDQADLFVFGEMITHLSEVFGIQIIGTPSGGGYLYGTRY